MSVATVMREIAFTPITADDHVILSPDGSVLKIPATVYQALAMFIGSHRKHEAGSVEMQFRNGGVAGVEAKVKLK